MMLPALFIFAIMSNLVSISFTTEETFMTSVNFNESASRQLFPDLFRTYMKAERPVVNESTVTHVRLDPVLINILEIDEVEESVSINFWMRMYWIDEFLRWDPDKYEGRNTIYIPQSMVWKPDIVLYNNLYNLNHVDSSILYVKVNSSGHVQYLFPTIYQCSCDLDIKYFPFDRQNCSLKFGSWSFDGAALDLEKTRDVPPLKYFKENPEWDLEGANVIKHNILYSCCPHPFPDITVYFRVKRKPLFYVITLIVPAFVITFLTLVGLFTPSQASDERDEKITMGMTCLLTIAVLLIMVADQLPRTSKVLPVLGVFYMYQMLICLLATLTTVVVINLEKKGHYGHEAPEWAKHLFIDVLPIFLGMKWKWPPAKKSNRRMTRFQMSIKSAEENNLDQHAEENGDYNLKKPNRHSPAPSMDNFFASKILESLSGIHARTLIDERQKQIVYDWDRICDCIDRICIWIYIILFLLGYFVIFFML